MRAMIRSAVALAVLPPVTARAERLQRRWGGVRAKAATLALWDCAALAPMVIGLIAAAMRTAPEKKRGDEVPVWREALLFAAHAIDARAGIARGWLDHRHQPRPGHRRGGRAMTVEISPPRVERYSCPDRQGALTEAHE